MTESSHRSAVSATVWPWRDRSAGQGSGSASSRRRHAVVESLVGYGVGLLMWFVFKKPVVACLVFAIATLVLVGGLFVPPIYNGFKKAGRGLATGVGIGMSWVLLVPFFYICFTFGRIVLLLCRKDPLNRKFPTGQPTYWVMHPKTKVPGRYSRQY